MKLLHTSDWHVGKVLKGQSRLDEQTRALAQLIEVANSEQPDLIVVAGDLYDTASPSPDATRVVTRAAWHYPQPTAGYEALAGHVAFYPGRMDRCTIDDETVLPQPGDFYGGWITSKVTGPFKGAPGTQGW